MSFSFRPGRWFGITALLLASVSTTQATTPTTLHIAPQTFTNDKIQNISVHSPETTTVQQLYLSPGGPSLSQSWSLPHPGQGLVWRDNKVYIAAGDGGLIIIDTHNNDTPILARLSVGDRINQVSISHHHAWLAAKGGVYTVDIRDPDSPRTRAFANTAQAVTALATNDKYAALIQGREVQLFNSRLPGQLQPLTTLQLNHDIHAIALDGQQLYLAAGDAGVLRYHINHEQKLRASGHYRTTGPAVDIQISNGIAVIATQGQGLTLLDVSDEGALHWLGSHQQAGRVQRLQLNVEQDQQQVMLLNEQQQLLLIDISNPRMPTMLSSLQLDAPGTALILHNNTVMALVDKQLQQLDFSAQPPPISNEGLDFGQGVNYGGERRVFIRDNIAYVADWFSGIHLYDIRIPQQPRLLSSFHTPGSAKGIVVRGDYAYVADDDHGLQIINIRNPRRPFKVGALQTAGLAYIPVLGSGHNSHRLYLASHRGGFQIIDISNPKKPTLLGRYNTAGKTWAIRIRDNIAYIADDDSGLMMFDVSQADNIQLVGQFSPGGEAEDLILHGNIAYVAFFNRGLYIIDISDPGYPKKLGHINTPGNARGIARHGTTLYIADWLAGIQVIDVSTPSRPQLIGSYDTAGAAWGLAIKNNFAFVTDWWGGFSILDISQPSRPTLAGRYHHRDRIHAISTQGNVAFAASGQAGLQIYDINNPLNPTWMTGVDFKVSAIDVVTTVQRAYVALSDRHIAIIDSSNPFSAYTLRQIRSPYPIVNLHLQEPWLIANHGDKGMTLYRIDEQYADKPRKKYRLKEAINHITLMNDQSMVIAQSNGVVKIHPQIGDKKSQQLFKKHITLLQGYKDYLIVATADNGIDIINKNGDLISHINIKQTLLDMKISDDTLYLIDDQKQLIIIGLSDINRPSIHSRYPMLNPSTRITVYNETVYLSGHTAITALRPLRQSVWIKDPNSDNDSHHILTIAADMPVGPYHLHLNQQRIDNVIHIERKKFSMPKFSMEDLNKALEKMRQPSAPP